MKAKLFTKNMSLGLLMAFVLALGVQGIAEAVTDPNLTVNSTDQILTETLHKVYGTFSITGLSTFTPDNPKKQEEVTIAKSNGIRWTGTYTGEGTIKLKESEKAGTNITGIADASPLAGSFTAVGRQWVTISGYDYTESSTTPGTYTSEKWSYTSIYYVTKPGSRTTTVSLKVPSTGYSIGIPVNSDIPIRTGDSNHYAVTYTVSGGKFAIRDSDTRDGESFSLTKEGNNDNPLIASSAFDVYLITTGTAVVTAQVENSRVKTVATYIVGSPKLTIGHPGDPNGDGTLTDATTGSKGTPGAINATLPIGESLSSRAFTATITDGSNSAVAGIRVKFEVKGSGDAGGYLVFNSTGDSPTNAGTLVTYENKEKLKVDDTLQKNDTAKILYVRTNSAGKADVDFQLGTDRKQDVTINAAGRPSKTVSAYAGTAGSGNQLVEPRSQSSEVSGRSGEYELRVDVEDEDGTALSNQYVEFRTTDGTLDDPALATDLTSLGGVRVKTDTRGTAFIFFDPADGRSSLRVTAHLLNLGVGNQLGGTGEEADSIIDDVVFDVKDGNGGGGGGGGTASLTITATGTGTTRSVTVAATDAQGAVDPGIFVTLSGTALPGGSQNVSSGTSTTITLPSTPGSYTLTAAASGYTSDTETLTITAPGTLSLEEVGARAATGGQSIRVTVRDSSGALASGAVTVTLSGAVSRTVPTTNGTGAAVITVPTTGGPHTVTLSATGYTTGQVTLSTAGQTTPTPTPTPTPTVSDPSRINIVGPSTRDGTANTELDAALIVQVVDEDGTAVPDARVIFRVRKGQGKLSLPGFSPRGNGRAVGVQTDSQGYGRAAYTPISASSTVEAEARGVTRSVTFTITASGGTAAPTTPDTGTGTTPGAISPVVHVGAAQRPPMLWVDSGAIYALVGKEVQKFAPGVDNANNIAVGGGKVYWTEKTGESGGTINSANLNGSGATELASILAVPMGIAVDTDNSKLYWTNSRGRIQSANLDGSGIKNVLQNLTSPLDIALAGGNAYWTEATGVKFVNLKGQKQVRNISTGMDTPGSLAIAGGKVYWTEATGESAGTVNSADLNGTGATELASIQAAPSGIAVDTARSKLYWTNSRGRIQSANLDGSKIQNVVSGLGSPGDMVLSNSITAPTATTTTTKTTTARSKYDVNGDGVVDGKDKVLVLEAVMAGTYVAKYDVNDDKKLDILDYVLVDVEVDSGAAGAPALLGMKMTAAQVDILQEQIDLLIATGDRSPDAMRILIYLQQLIATARPEKTQLLANYPNPFNPETWIPYELADATQVKITIYNAQGVVIRTLQLGQQSAGYYTDRDRAAYWDGRNALGEQVASGIYFYQLETDEMSALRKMVILK